MKNKKRIVVLVGLLYFVFSGCGRKTEVYFEPYKETATESKQTETEQLTQIPETEAEQRSCFVYICGAVVSPGVYELLEGSRIYQVIELAGGLTEEADHTFVNQAEPVTDGMMIRIYTTEEVSLMNQGIQESDTKGAEEDGRVNINTADVREFMTLSGIGSAKAEAIVSYRREHGDFACIEDLMKVPGIKEGVFYQIRDSIKAD